MFFNITLFAFIYKVRQFRLLSRKFLPQKHRQAYSLNWEPIFTLMESAPGMDLNLNAQESFKIGYEHLKSRVEYIFNSPKMKHDTWRVAYWCVKIQRSSILKSGTESDIAKLPAGKGKNKARQQRTRVNDEGREVKRRRIKKTRTPAVIENNVDDAPPLDGTTITGFVPIIRPVTQEEAEIQQQHTNESSLIEIDLDNTKDDKQPQ